MSTRYPPALTIRGADYGSVNPSILLLHKRGLMQFHERGRDAAGNSIGDRAYSFTVQPGAA